MGESRVNRFAWWNDGELTIYSCDAGMVQESSEFQKIFSTPYTASRYTWQFG
jgi:hypothetical protein